MVKTYIFSPFQGLQGTARTLIRLTRTWGFASLDLSVSNCGSWTEVSFNSQYGISGHSLLLKPAYFSLVLISTDFNSSLLQYDLLGFSLPKPFVSSSVTW